jgi:hypothetical protein
MKVIKRGKTKDYSQFGLKDGNRGYKPNHAAKLAQSISEHNMLDVFPVICQLTKKGLLVIDGQHRLAACKKLEIAVPYVVIEGLDHADMARINATVKAWGTKDFLQHFCSIGIESYIRLREFVESTKLPVAVCVDLMSGRVTEGGGTGCSKDFRAGAFVVRDLEHADRVARLSNKLSECGCRFSRERSLIKALHMIMRYVPDFDGAKLANKSVTNPISKRATWKDYIDVIEIIYNYRSPMTDRLHIKAIMTDNGAFR